MTVTDRQIGHSSAYPTFIDLDTARRSSIGFPSGIAQRQRLVHVDLHIIFCHSFPADSQRLNLGQRTHGFAGNLHIVTISGRFAVANDLQIITAYFFNTFRYGKYSRIACLFYDHTGTVEQFPVGSGVTGIDIRNFEALARLDGSFIYLYIVGNRITHTHIIAPCDLGIGLHIDRNGCDTETNLLFALQIGRNREIHTGPRSSDTHELRLTAFLLSVQFEHRSIHVEVINRLARQFVVIHVKYHLTIYTFVVRCKNFGNLNLGSRRCRHSTAGDRKFTEV